MLMIAKAVSAVYMWIIFPVVLGNIWLESGKKIMDHVAFTYLMGLISEWAAFLVLAKYAIARGMTLHELCRNWIIVLVILTLVALVLGIKQGHFSVRKLKKCRIEFVAGGVLLLLLVATGMICGGTNQSEYTVESVLTMYATDTLYQYDATTGQHLDEMLSVQKEEIENDSKAPVEAYYAVNAFICKLNSTKFIKVLLPLFLLPFYYGVYDMWANALFPGNWKKRIGFQVVLWLWYASAIISEKAILFNILINCWNGETLFFTGLLPLAVWLLFEKNNKTRWGMQYMVCALAGQLLYVNGGFVITFLWVIAILAEGIKRWKNDSSI